MLTHPTTRPTQHSQNRTPSSTNQIVKTADDGLVAGAGGHMTPSVGGLTLRRYYFRYLLKSNRIIATYRCHVTAHAHPSPGSAKTVHHVVKTAYLWRTTDRQCDDLGLE